jgi:hypothetical protein
MFSFSGVEECAAVTRSGLHLASELYKAIGSFGQEFSVRCNWEGMQERLH